MKLLIIKHNRRELRGSVVVLMENCLEARTLSLVWTLLIPSCEILGKTPL